MALAGWDSDKKIEAAISSSLIDAALTDFPVLVNVSAASGQTLEDLSVMFDELGSNSLKIAVEVGDSGVECYVEIERWDAAAESAQLWVKVPAVSSSADTVLNLYYDSTHADNTSYVGAINSTPGATVWDADFVAVYHLSQDPTTSILDSTGSSNDLTTVTGLDSSNIVAGDVGKCLRIDTNDHAYTALADFSALQTAFTIEAYAKWISTGVAKMFSSCGDQGYGCLQHCLNATGAVYANSVGGDLVDTAFVPSTTVWRHEAQAMAAGVATCFENGTASPATNNVTVENLSSDRIRLASRFDGYYANYYGREIRYSKAARSAAWLAATAVSLADALITYTVPVVPSSGLPRSYLDQSYGLKLGAELEQSYNIYGPIQSALDQVWGVKLLGQLRQPYGNAATPQAVLVNWYGDAAEVQASLVQRWGDALAVQSALEQIYNLPAALQSVLEQRYSITGTEVQAVLEQMYNLHEYNMVQSILRQPWMIAAAESLQAAVASSATVGGRVWDGYHINVESNWSMYEMSCDLQTADQAEYAQVQRFEDIVISISGTEYRFIVINRRRTRQPGSFVYIVEGSSRAVLMDAPWAEPLLRKFDAGWASDIATELAAPFGVTIDWQIVDWQIQDNTLHANDETPLVVLRKIAHAAGGHLQCLPDGTLRVRPGYPVSPPPTYNGRANWDTVDPAAALTDQDNFFTAEESPDDRDGFNKFLISNQLAATASDRLDSEDVSATRKLLRAYIVPWTDRGSRVLKTSREGVSIEPLTVSDNGRLVTELVEFVNGAGQSDYPMHELVDMEWQDAPLGSLTYAEDGTLQAEVAGQSLLSLTYRTNFLLWQADDPRIEDVQFYLEVEA